MITKHMFQFHNGTINTMPMTESKKKMWSFNSTTVQLIRNIAGV